METIRFNNYGMTNIEWLISKWEGKHSTLENIQLLKQDIRDGFYNNPYIDFTTKGSVSCHLVDTSTMNNCEIVYS